VGFSGVGGSLYRSLIRHYPANRVAAAFEGASVARELVVASVSPEQWVNIFRLTHR
jgi:23S rRNA (adenine-N6)-dimethyltransferase